VIGGAAWREAAAEWVSRPVLVLGVGNPLRGDDAAGPLVCERLDSPSAVDCADAPERYVGLAGGEGVERVLLVDAADFGGRAGDIAFLAADDLVERFGTTHDSGLAVLSRFIQEEYGKPVAVLGIQPGDTRFGAQVCAAVRDAVETVSALLKSATSQWNPDKVEAAWTPS
jgi:hydrogenase 3 maturation protease